MKVKVNANIKKVIWYVRWSYRIIEMSKMRDFPKSRVT